MQKEKVRCWELKVKNGSSFERIYITYPEGSLGHKLISCLHCGEIFAVNLTKELYIDPSLNERLEKILCTGCGVILADTTYEYPDKYLSIDGLVHEHKREPVLLNDETSIVKEFLEIYS